MIIIKTSEGMMEIFFHNLVKRLIGGRDEKYKSGKYRYPPKSYLY